MDNEFTMQEQNEDLKEIKYLLRKQFMMTTILLITLIIISLVHLVFDITNTDKVRKRVDYRYFNITRSLQDIHQVDLNTKDGSIIRVR
jgi:uncharacterized membrane protein